MYDGITIDGIYGIQLVPRGKGFQKYLINDISKPGTETAILMRLLCNMVDDGYDSDGLPTMIVYYKDEFYCVRYSYNCVEYYHNHDIHGNERPKYFISGNYLGTEVIYLTHKVSIVPKKLKTVKNAIRKFLS